MLSPDIKDYIEENLSKELNLIRVTAAIENLC